MTRFKRKNIRRRARSAFRSFSRRGRRSGGTSNSGAVAIVIGGAAYGAGRQYVSNKLATMVPNFAGEWTDEVVMAGISYALARGKVPGLNKIPYSRDIGRAGLAIEAARVGGALVGKMGNGTLTNGSLQATAF